MGKSHGLPMGCDRYTNHADTDQFNAEPDAPAAAGVVTYFIPCRWGMTSC